MNQERSRRGKADNLQANNSKTAGQNIPLAELLEAPDTKQLSNSSQITPLHQPLWFWLQHSSWSHFHRGLFWGGVISFVAVFSAIAGVILTEIEAIEQAILHRINHQIDSRKLAASATLNSPVDVLLLEVKSQENDIIEFSLPTRGQSQTIILLKLQPQLNAAQAIYIPHNSSVLIPGFGRGTVKDAYQMGGIKLLSQVVNQIVGDTSVKHYVRATPEIWQQLTASGKITLRDCDSIIRDCSLGTEAVRRQQATFNTIRQRLNIPPYLAQFETAIALLESELDADVAVEEIITWANFIKELEPENINVDLLPGYTPGETLPPANLAVKSHPIAESQLLEKIDTIAPSHNHPFQDRPIAVQNTTKNPELGIQMVAYLRYRNFRQVYLVRHRPLKLEQTRIIVNHRQIDTANYLQNILGFGNLKTRSKSNSHQDQITIQVGADALYLPTNHRTYNQF